MKRLTVFALISSALLVACGEEETEEPPPPAPERCQADDLKSYAEGAVFDDEQHTSLNLSSNDVSGRIFDDRELRIRLGNAAPPGEIKEQPVILRLVSNEEEPEFTIFAEQIADTTSPQEPMELQIYDATDYSGLGSEDLTSLSDYGCSIDDDGTVCAQLGFDASNNGVLDDDDEYVFNAAGGTITIEGFSSSTGRLFAHWDIELGPNLFSFQDESRGDFEGCMWPEYDSRAPGDYWALE